MTAQPKKRISATDDDHRSYPQQPPRKSARRTTATTSPTAAASSSSSLAGFTAITIKEEKQDDTGAKRICRLRSELHHILARKVQDQLRQSLHQSSSNNNNNDNAAAMENDHSFLLYEYFRCAEHIDRRFGIFPSLEVEKDEDEARTYSVVVMGFDDNYQSIGMVIRDDDSVEKPTEIPPTFMPIGGSGIDTSDGKMKMGNHVHAVSAGGLHSVALIDGVPYSWGNSDHGTLGRLDVQGDDMMAATPGPITGFRKRDPKNYGSIISEDGQIVQIVAGEAQTLFVSASGSVYQCGSYKDMDSGTFSDVDPLQNSSSAKGANLRPVHVGQLEQPVLSVFTQGSFNAALLSDGTLMTWGFGNHGELARSATMMTKPNKKDGSYDLEKNFFYKLAVDPETGEEFLKPNLSIVEQQFLKPQPVLYDPQLPILKREVIAVATGQYHLLVVARDPGSNFGKVYASGMNNYGQLGTGDVRDRHALTHVETLASENIVNVAAGEHHSLVLTHDRRRIYSFGRADYGQLGIGVMDKASLTGGSRATPQQVYFPEFVHFTRIDCGDRTCFAITKDYELYTWGFNETMATGHPIIPAYDVYRPRKLDLSKIQDHPNAENDPQNQSNRFRNVRVHAVSGGGHHTILLVSKSAGNNENASPK